MFISGEVFPLGMPTYSLPRGARVTFTAMVKRFKWSGRTDADLVWKWKWVYPARARRQITAVSPL